MERKKSKQGKHRARQKRVLLGSGRWLHCTARPAKPTDQSNPMPESRKWASKQGRRRQKSAIFTATSP